jgi:hypothetical protein
MALHQASRFCSKVLYCCAALLLSPIALAQGTDPFDPIAATGRLGDIQRQFDSDELSPAALGDLRTEIVAIEAAATACARSATDERARLEARFEPLRDIDADVAGTVMDQRNEIRRLLDETIARQAECAGLQDQSDALIERISQMQTALSQQYLSNRVNSIIGAVRDFPRRAAAWPERIRRSVELELVEWLTPLSLFWLLVIAGLGAATAGIMIRQRFTRWFEKGGGAAASPRMKYLFPKPLAEYSPLILEGLALVAVLLLAIENASFDLAVVRFAAGILLYGVGCVVIDWATGPLSPSANIKGFIPDHVAPLRLRLRLFLLAITMSFVVLGTNWLNIRVLNPDVGGRATMIFLVAISLISVIHYLGRIRSLRGRYRLIRFGGMLTLLVGIGALMIGYQNFAGYLVHGVTRTALALLVIWILLWVVVKTFRYLIRQDTPTATQLRANLGMTESASRTSLGFMQLIADLLLWLGLLI